MKKIIKKIFSKPSFFLIYALRPFKQDILILVNKGDRDTLGLFLVYCHLKYVYRLKIKIHSVLFLQHFWFKLYRPSVVVSIFIDNESTKKSYELLGKMGCFRIMSPTETFLYGDENFFLGSYDFHNLTEKILLAGEEMKKIYLKNNKASESMLKVVGYPTLDWSKEVGRLFLPSRIEFKKKYGIASDKKIILIATSFNMADINIDEWDTKYRHLNLTREKAIALIQATKIIRNKTLAYIPKLLKSHPDWHLIIKKHPFEKGELYARMFSKNERVTQLDSVQFYNLMNISDVLVHWHSTTSVQAWGFSKPTILLWFEESKIIGIEKDSDQQLGNYICSSYEELEKSLEDSLSGRSLPAGQVDAREKYIKKWYSKLDGLSSKRAAQEIYETFESKKNDEIRHLMSIIDFIRGTRDILKYLSFLNLMVFCDKINIYMPDWISRKIAFNYDNFHLERHKIRHERKIKKYLLSKTGIESRNLLV